MADLDTLDFVDAVHGLPEQVSAAHKAAGAVPVDRFPSADDVDSIVVCGMGGSGISGDVLASVGRHALPVPITVVKDYDAPVFINERTLVFAQSYSGDTEETLTTTHAALDAGATVVAVTSGGTLGALAQEHDLLRFDCPPGLQPRAALGGLVVPLFVTGKRSGLLPDAHTWLLEAEKNLAVRRDACAPDVTGDANPARELARKIGRTVPLIYGGAAIGGVAAMRWKCDINENAKAPAIWNVYPELDHNELCGWGQHGDVTRQVFTLVTLRHDFEGDRVPARIEATTGLIDEALADTLEVRATGEGPLAQLLDLMYVGDWTSLFLAYANEVDPGPIDAIQQLKSELAGSGL